MGEVVAGGRVLRPLGGAEARMQRGEKAPARRQPVEHRGARVDADAGMQKQDRPPAAALDHLDADAIDRNRRRRCRPGRWPARLACRNWHFHPSLLYYVKSILFYRTNRKRTSGKDFEPPGARPPAFRASDARAGTRSA